MGLTHVRARVANPAKPTKMISIRFLVDSGAVYSVVPASRLHRLGIRAHSSRAFMLADGTEITRRIGDAIFVFDGQRGASPVIFGEQDDAALLGTVSLESLGLILDPMKRVLRPLPMVLGQTRVKAKATTRPYEVYRNLDLGSGGRANAPSSRTRAGVKRAIRKKLGR